VRFHRLGAYTSLDKLKRRLLIKKLWLTVNAFVLMPAYSWFMCVYLYPKIEEVGKSSLTAWFSFWIVALIIGHSLYMIFIFLAIGDLKLRIDGIEHEMERNR
jgi:hypothetical protein